MVVGRGKRMHNLKTNSESIDDNKIKSDKNADEAKSTESNNSVDSQETQGEES